MKTEERINQLYQQKQSAEEVIKYLDAEIYKLSKEESTPRRTDQEMIVVLEQRLNDISKRMCKVEARTLPCMDIVGCAYQVLPPEEQRWINREEVNKQKEMGGVFPDIEIASTFEDVWSAVRPVFYIGGGNDIMSANRPSCSPTNFNNLPTKNDCKQIQAIIKMKVVAKFLNGDWERDLDDCCYYIVYMVNTITVMQCFDTISSNVIFKSHEAAQEAIHILGEDTVMEYLGIFKNEQE